MVDSYLLAQDIGTSSTKTTLVNQSGQIIDTETSAHQTFYPEPDWAEQNPEDWWQGVCQNTGNLMDSYPEIRNKIVGIGVSGLMLNCLPLDKNGNVLRPCMIHADNRSCVEFEQIGKEVGKEKLYNITGNNLDVRSPLCKILWLKNNEPEIYRNTDKFLQAKDYIVGYMIDEFKTTDYSDASHAQWINIHKREYIDDIFQVLGIDENKFPELHKATDVVGELDRKAAQQLNLPAGIPVIAGGGDGSCASVGAGAVTAGDIYCCLGTTAWIASTVSTPVIDTDRRIFNIISLDGESSGMFGTVQAAGRAVDWIMDLLSEENYYKFDEILDMVKPGSDKLIFLPYLEGERSPIFDANARGVFFGINTSHKREHFFRSTIEGVSFALNSVLDVIEEKMEIESLKLIGGGGRSKLWKQILANIFNKKIKIPSTRTEDATSLGAAIAAGVGVGLFESIDEANTIISIEKEITPTSETVKVYNDLYRIYRSLYPRLKDLYQDLNEI